MVRKLARMVRSAIPIPVRRRISSYLAQGADEFPSIRRAMETLAVLGFEPQLCVDVGAYHGEWTEMCCSIFPATRVMMVEAQEEKRSALQNMVDRSGGAVHLEIALLGAEEGRTVQFTIMETGIPVF